MELLKTSLHDEHINLKAKLAPFAGYEMPIQYTSVKDEVLAVRNHCGVFDVSHMGEFFVEGPDAIRFVDYLITNDFLNAESKKAVYSPLCRDNGTIVDDLICYKLRDDKVLICVNASNIEKDWSWINSKKGNFNCHLTNASNEYSLLAIQGPKTEEILKLINVLKDENMPYYSIIEKEVKGNKTFIARTGYTGEDGFEIFGGHEFIKWLWSELLNSKVVPCGLAARDVLRLEVCFPLYGHELNDEVTPLDVGLNWTVKFDKPDFVGKSFLQSYQPQFQLVKIILEKGIPREGYEILNISNQVIGKVTSGTMSVMLNKGVAIGIVKKNLLQKDDQLKVNIRNNMYDAQLTKKAFVVGGHK